MYNHISDVAAIYEETPSIIIPPQDGENKLKSTNGPRMIYAEAGNATKITKYNRAEK